MPTSFSGAALPFWDLFLRLTVAALLGGVIGFERERHEKPAGLRTHMLVTLGSAAFVVIGVEVLGQISEGYDHARLDPTRVIEGVIGGIGFLGAGSIIQSRGDVRGLTTAASVWISGALGAACGVAMYRIAIVTTAFALVTLWLVGVVQKKTLHHDRTGSDARADRGPD